MPHPTLPPAPERVAAGARLLDRAWPGWAARVDPARLDQAESTGDLLGQLGGWADAALRRLAPPDAEPDLGAWAARHGFDRDDGEPETVYDELTAAWRAELARRTDKAPAPAAGQLDPATLPGLLAVPELSLAAKAALLYAAARPAGRPVTRAELAGLGRDARWQVDAALSELVEDGWLTPTGSGFVLRTDPDPDTGAATS